MHFLRQLARSHVTRLNLRVKKGSCDISAARAHAIPAGPRSRVQVGCREMHDSYTRHVGPFDIALWLLSFCSRLRVDDEGRLQACSVVCTGKGKNPESAERPPGGSAEAESMDKSCYQVSIFTVLQNVSHCCRCSTLQQKICAGGQRYPACPY